MRCPQCDAEMPPRGEFCPQCGTAASPGLRERMRARASGGGGEGGRAHAPADRSEEELKRNRRNVLMLGAAFVFGLAIGGQGGWFEFGDDDEGWRRPAVIAAQDLFDAYRDDADEARERFDDRFLVVTGEFVAINTDDNGNPDLRLRTSDPTTPLGADLLQRSHAQSRRLQPGDTVTIGCERVVSTGEEDWLQNCAIEAVVPAAAAASGTLPAPAASEAGAAPTADAAPRPPGPEEAPTAGGNQQ